MRIHRPLLSSIAALAILSLSSVASAQKTERVVLGRVAEVLKPAKVYQKPSLGARVYFEVDPEQYYVVLTDAPKGWAKLLLNNGEYGYIQAGAVEPMDFEVTADRPIRSGRSTYLASRSGARATAADRGLDFLGTPYKWGGNDIENGIDCSAFVKELYGEFGMRLPRTAAEQANVGIPITRLEQLQKGDRLYFWDFKRNKIGHTGLYLGNGRFVHSSSSRGGVQVDDIRDPKWMRILVAARR